MAYLDLVNHLLFLVGESGERFALEDGFAAAVDTSNECCRTVAYCRDDLTSVPELIA